MSSIQERNARKMSNIGVDDETCIDRQLDSEKLAIEES